MCFLILVYFALFDRSLASYPGVWSLLSDNHSVEAGDFQLLPSSFFSSSLNSPSMFIHGFTGSFTSPLSYFVLGAQLANSSLINVAWKSAVQLEMIPFAQSPTQQPLFLAGNTLNPVETGMTRHHFATKQSDFRSRDTVRVQGNDLNTGADLGPVAAYVVSFRFCQLFIHSLID